MKILTASQMQRIDRLTTESCGIPSLLLMENAGLGVVELLDKHFTSLQKERITVLCGPGNNGGDGLVVARQLGVRGLRPRTLLLADPRRLKGDAAHNYRMLSGIGGEPRAVSDFDRWTSLTTELGSTSLFIDAIFGTGLTRALEGFYLEVVRDLEANYLEKSGVRWVAVDLPTGISSDSGELTGPCLRADFTVTFTAPKVAHVFPPACERMGEWEVKHIGTPPRLLDEDPELLLNLTTGDHVESLLSHRAPGAHKGNFGHVLLLAGSRGKTGAAALAAQAALRVGAGLATVGTPSSALPVIASLAPEFMTEALTETNEGTVSREALDYGRLDKLVEGKAVLAVGPGLTTVEETSELIRRVVARYECPMVLDADGLNAFAGCIDTLTGKGRTRVLTPHPGEMARLMGLSSSEVQAARIDSARELAGRNQLHVVLKGYRTLTADPAGEVWVNPTGNPGMATGGTGDVLTGMVAGLLAQYPDPPVAQVVAAAVYLHGLAGDLAVERVGQEACVASNILDTIPEAFRNLRRKSEGRADGAASA